MALYCDDCDTYVLSFHDKEFIIISPHAWSLEAEAWVKVRMMTSTDSPPWRRPYTCPVLSIHRTASAAPYSWFHYPIAPAFALTFMSLFFAFVLIDEALWSDVFIVEKRHGIAERIRYTLKTKIVSYWIFGCWKTIVYNKTALPNSQTDSFNKCFSACRYRTHE